VHPIATQCRVLGVSASGYYAWAVRPASARATADVALMEQIRVIHTRSRATYGERRIHAELGALGVRVGRKRVARLMRALSLTGVSRRKGTRTTIRDREARPAPDLVDRDFTAAGPDRLWVADITYVPTWAGFSTSPSSSMRGAAGSSVGRWRRTCGPSSCSRRSTWRSRRADRSM